MAPPRGKNEGGRPRKFAEPSRPVTLTLPENTLRDLQLIDPDRALAIVKLTRKAVRQQGGSKSPVSVIEMASDIGLVVVGPSRALSKIPFLHLIQVEPGRFLLALEPGTGFTNLEIALNDTLDDLPAGEKQEREFIQQLMAQIRSLRKTERMRMVEILFVSLKGQKTSKKGHDKTRE